MGENWVISLGAPGAEQNCIVVSSSQLSVSCMSDVSLYLLERSSMPKIRMADTQENLQNYQSVVQQASQVSRWHHTRGSTRVDYLGMSRGRHGLGKLLHRRVRRSSS